MNPILSVEELATMLDMEPEEIRDQFDVFGEPGDESVLREDVLAFLERSEI